MDTKLFMIFVLVFAASGGTKGGGTTCADMGKGTIDMHHHKGTHFGIEGFWTKAPIVIILVIAVVGLVVSGYNSFIADIFVAMLMTLGMNQAGA